MTATTAATAAIQTVWAELIAATLADSGVQLVVLSPGSRSTPLAAAIASEPRLELVTIIDERAAGFYALGAARATGAPAAVVCTSGSAAAHYVPAIVEASAAAVPMIAITANRPPELRDCGANQTIDQAKLYGTFARGAFDLGTPDASELALRAVRRKIAQAVTLARGPHPGPVQVDVPLRKPLEPAAPMTAAEHAFARYASELRAQPIAIAVPTIAPDHDALDALAAAIDATARGAFIVGATPVAFPRDALDRLADQCGYAVLAETGSQARALFANELVDFAPELAIQIGGEPLSARAAQATWVLAPHAWSDPTSSARGVIIGDVAASLARLEARVHTRAQPAWLGALAAHATRVEVAVARASELHAGNEIAVVGVAIATAAGAGAQLQLGNSLPVRVADLAPVAPRVRAASSRVLTQRGASGIDGLIASATGATHAGATLLVLGDVSFAHDLGALLVARHPRAPLAILVVDNAGGRIFDQLPIARAGMDRAAYERCFTTPPAIDPVAVAAALGLTAVRADSPDAVAAAIRAALRAEPARATIIHAPVTPTGAADVIRTARELLATAKGTSP